MNKEEFLAAYAGGRRDFSYGYIGDGDFRGINSEDGDFRNVDFTRLTFLKSIVRRAKLDRGAIEAFYAAGVRTFSDCDLSGADLRGIDFSLAVLKDINLTGAKLDRGAIEAFYAAGVRIFSKCDLSGIDFRDVDLRGVAIDGVALDRNGFLSLCAARVRTFSDCDLSGADLRGIDFSLGVFKDINLTGAKLDRRASLSLYFAGIRDFRGAVLAGSKLDKVTLDRLCEGGCVDFSGCDLGGVSFRELTIKDGVSGEPDRLQGLLGEPLHEIIVNEVKVLDCATHGSIDNDKAEKDPPTDDNIWDLFMDVYAHFASQSSKAAGTHKLGFFGKARAKAVAAVTGCYPKKLDDDKKLSASQRLLRLKCYADNNPKTDTGKAWHAMGSQVQAYQVLALGGDRAWLLLPGNMNLSFGEDGVCNGYRVGDELNPEEWRGVFDACRVQCVNQFPPVASEEAAGEPNTAWTLKLDKDGTFLYLGGIAMLFGQDGPAHTDGGGAAEPRP